MDGRTCTNGQMEDGWKDGWMDGWTDGQTDISQLTLFDEAMDKKKVSYRSTLWLNNSSEQLKYGISRFFSLSLSLIVRFIHTISYRILNGRQIILIVSICLSVSISSSLFTLL